MKPEKLVEKIMDTRLKQELAGQKFKSSSLRNQQNMILIKQKSITTTSEIQPGKNEFSKSLTNITE
jgi:hypothetical protein